jgi:hypothetical protein
LLRELPSPRLHSGVGPAKVPRRQEPKLMSIQAVLSPLFAQVMLTFVLMYWMAFLRTTALTSGEIGYGDVALREQKWPTRCTQIANAFHNQLELPVLFYVLTILVGTSGQADLAFVIMAWVFVMLRIVHAAIHVTTNNVRQRGAIFGLSALVLTAMWVLFMLRVMFAAP